MKGNSNKNNDQNDKTAAALQLNHSPRSLIQFEEYYENNEQNELKEGQIPLKSKEQEDNYDYDNDNNNDYDNDFEDIKGKEDHYDMEREEMENDYELMKNLNALKEKNKKLESMNKYQKIKIDSLEGELDKTIGQLKIKDAEIEDLKSSSGNANSNSNHKVASYVAQINNLNLQLDKYKALVQDKKNEYATLLEKYNEIHKSYDQCIVAEKKTKQELISKDKQISKLIDDLDKKNIVITSSTAQQLKEKEIERLTQENKKLEKQKNEIYAAFKKSLKLCSILKREKVHLENGRLLAFTEDEFRNLLEINKI